MATAPDLILKAPTPLLGHQHTTPDTVTFRGRHGLDTSPGRDLFRRWNPASPDGTRGTLTPESQHRTEATRGAAQP
jgi:hypothetical protein